MDTHADYVEYLFLVAYGRLEVEIRRIAHRRNGIHWLDEGECFNWLLHELWRACATFDASAGDKYLTLEKYWWKLWENRRWKLNKSYYTYKEEANRLPFDFQVIEERAIGDDQHRDQPLQAKVQSALDRMLRPANDLPPCPVDGGIESRVWRMLAHGFTQKEIQELLYLDNSMLRKILGAFRTEEIRELLLSVV